MRDAWWTPQPEQKPERYERPFLEAPSPYERWPVEPERAEQESDDDSPRVVIIDM